MEFQTVLYTEPVASSKLPSEHENCFLILHTCMRLFCNSSLLNDEDVINDIARIFVENTIDLFRRNFVSYNIHNFIHLTDDVRNFGNVDNFSCF